MITPHHFLYARREIYRRIQPNSNSLTGNRKPHDCEVVLVRGATGVTHAHHSQKATTNAAAPIPHARHLKTCDDIFWCSDTCLTHVRFSDTRWQLESVAANGALASPGNLDASGLGVHYLVVVHLSSCNGSFRFSFEQGKTYRWTHHFPFSHEGASRQPVMA